MAVEHKSVPTLGGSIKKTRAHEAAAPVSGEAVVSEIMRAYRTIDALTAENARLSDRLTAAMEGGRAERPDILSDKLRALGIETARRAVNFGRPAIMTEFEHGGRVDAVEPFDRWCRDAIDGCMLPENLSVVDVLSLFRDEMAAAYEARRAEAEKRLAEKAADKENGRK